MSQPPLFYESLSPDHQYRNWRAGLIAFGVIAILMGAAAGCMGLFTPLGVVMPQPGQAHVTNRVIGSVISGAILMVVTAACLIWVGIGAIRAQRWVRPIVLIGAVLSIVMGVFALIGVGVAIPGIRRSINAAGAGPAAAGAIIGVAVMMGLMAVVLILIPAAALWFFRRREVEETLRFFDPSPSWTDRVPIQVLAVTLVLAVSGIGLVISAIQAMAPQFGVMLAGVPAVALLLAEALLALALAYLCFRRSPLGWWGTLAAVVLWGVSIILTAIRSNDVEFYRRAGLSQQEMAFIEQSTALRGPVMLLNTVPILVLAIAYLLWAKRYFVRPVGSALADAEPLDRATGPSAEADPT